MIKVELKLQPEGEPQKVDGLLWGRKKPMQFLGMTEQRDGLVGRDGTYLFRPVCYADPGCFVPRRYNTLEHPSRNRVLEFPDSDPILLVKIDAWYSESEIDGRVLEMRRAWPKRKKAEWIEIGKRLELDADTLTAMKKAEVEEAVLRADAQITEETATTLYIHWYMKAIVGKDEADRRLESIRYAVKYRNDEVLYLSDLERLAPRVEFGEGKSERSKSTQPLETKERMNQTKAANYLDISTRTLRRWRDNGWVKEHKHEGKSNPWYFRGELDQARAERGV